MQNENLVPASEFCVHHNIEFSFINALHEYGLVEIEHIEKTEFISVSQLPELERYIRLHYDLDINLEGIEAITHLLQRVKEMQDEMMVLKNKLRMYGYEKT